MPFPWAKLIPSLISAAGALVGAAGEDDPPPNQPLGSFFGTELDPVRYGTDVSNLLGAIGAARATQLGEPIRIPGGAVQQPPVFCLKQTERILRADMRWIPSGDIKAGDQILAFEEFAGSVRGGRLWQPAVVTMSHPTRAACVRVSLADGSQVICTADHPWLVDPGIPARSSKRRWVRADQLMHQRANRKVRMALKALQPWTDAADFEAGWLSGMFDGEGYVGLCTGGGIRLGLAQKPGLLADRVMALCRRLGFAISPSLNTSHRDSPILNIMFRGGFGEIARFLGHIRPQRLMDKWLDRLPGRRIHGCATAVEAVEPIGHHDIQSISSTARTYVGEGFMMHNTGGGLPMPIGVTGVDPALLDPSILERPGLPPEVAALFTRFMPRAGAVPRGGRDISFEAMQRIQAAVRANRAFRNPGIAEAARILGIAPTPTPSDERTGRRAIPRKRDAGFAALEEAAGARTRIRRRTEDD